jgi:hypothetical protein
MDKMRDLFVLVNRGLQIITGIVNVFFKIFSGEEAADEVIEMVINERLKRLWFRGVVLLEKW